jgi:1-acyl-sn-glycerol-3-phosphate acyltransferase
LKLRGYLAVAAVCLGLVVSDAIQRFVVSPWVKLRPSRRIPVLTRWIKMLAWLTTRPLVFIGGARLQVPPCVVPSAPGTLILMNHQSLFDIPLVVQTVRDGYPLIVTRARYSRFVPLISHLIRLYQYPVVDPTANRRELRESIDSLGERGRNSEVPIAMFPEGTRTKNGDIGRFKSAGMKRLLSERTWIVHIFVTDGLWSISKFKDFIKGMAEIDGKVVHVGTLEWTDVEADPDGFIAETRDMMVAGMDELRSGGTRPA